MPDLSLAAEPDVDSIARSARRKVAWRVLPLLLFMYVIAYLDRVNAGFAKLQMQRDLEFTDQVFGWGFGLFFVGYMLLEIPGALFVEHWSARKWFARILVTWGICSMGMALVQTPEQFYIARFLLGLAEAGFFPGVIIYFTHWFPRKYRAKAFAGMLIAIPASQALGAYASAGLLRLDWLGLAGWQWVFLVEGAPAVLLGVLIPFLLPDRPRDAKWLTPAERDWLEQTLEAEKQQHTRIGEARLIDVLQLRTVWLLAFGILATNVGGLGMVFWLPTVVRGILGTNNLSTDDTQVLLWTGPVFLCGLIGVRASGWSSDRLGDRKWHCVFGQVGTACCLVASAIPELPWHWVFVCLCLAGFFANFWFSPYWVLPTLALTSSAAAVAIGIINMCANIPGFVSNYILGWMKNAGWTDSDRLMFLAGGFLLGAVFIALVRIEKPIITPGIPTPPD